MATFSEGAQASSESSRFRRDLVQNVRVKDIQSKWENIIYARTDETISTVFKKLIDNSILSVPLLDIDTQKYISFIDITDILAYVVDILKLPIESDESWMLSSQFQNTSCIVLPNRSQRNPWYVISDESPLQAVINIMCESNIKRVAVIDQSGIFTGVVTQSRLVRYLYNHRVQLGDLGLKTIEQLNIAQPLTETVGTNERVLDAFLKMYNSNVSGIPVINQQGKIVGNISVSDLKDIGFTASMFRKLFMANDNFLESKVSGRNVKRFVWCYGSSSFHQVLEKMSTAKVHRVYVVKSDEMMCYGIISTLDVLKALRNV